MKEKRRLKKLNIYIKKKKRSGRSERAFKQHRAEDQTPSENRAKVWLLIRC